MTAEELVRALSAGTAARLSALPTAKNGYI